jgi:hypothetical protein
MTSSDDPGKDVDVVIGRTTAMLGNEEAVANVAVKDVDVATKFYRNTLGLKARARIRIP